MKRSTQKALNENRDLLALLLIHLIDDASILLAILNGTVPIRGTLKGSDRPKTGTASQLPLAKKPPRVFFTDEEEDYLDEEGFKELARRAIAARVTFREIAMLRRHGK